MVSKRSIYSENLCQALENSWHEVTNMETRKKIYTDILNTCGHTPLVKLNKISREDGVRCQMYAKCEFMNPGGSVKDRIAYRMVLDAEKAGRITPGVSVLIEPTSGNTGVGLALAGAVKGYRVIIVMPDKDSDEKAKTMMALGAEVIRTHSDVASDSPDGDIGTAKRLAKEIPNAVILDQFDNVSNPLAHYDTTAEELLWALDGKIDMVVIGAGSGGTVSGIGCKIKASIPDCIVVGVDPYGSVFAPPKTIGPYEVEGIGGDSVPGILDFNIIDKWVKVHDGEAFKMARRLIKAEGYLCGGSSGAAMWAAVQLAQTMHLGPEHQVVVIMPDTIRNYMTRFVTDEWMEARHYRPFPSSNVSWWNQIITNNRMPYPYTHDILTCNVNEKVNEVLQKLISSSSPCAAILDNHGLVGVTSVDKIRKCLASSKDPTTRTLQDPIKDFQLTQYYKVDITQPPTLGYISRVLDITPFIVVVRHDPCDSTILNPIGIITSATLMSAVTFNQCIS